MKRRAGIIGGGASGVLAAIHLLIEFGSDVEILLFETRDKIAEGLAYSTPSTSLILNVPVEKMSATRDPQHFKNWCAQHHPELSQSPDYPFVPRSYFADYLRDTLAKLELEKQNTIQHVRENVRAISPDGLMWTIEASGGDHVVQNVIVATGYRSQLPVPQQYRDRRVLQPYDIVSLKNIRSNETVLIVGAGLAAIDCWRFLRSEGYSGKIVFTSRRAQFPLEHVAGAKPTRLPKLAGLSPRQITALVRGLHKMGGQSFVQLADGIRAQIPEIWCCWSDQEKAQFLRHVKPYWEVIRHRVPRSVGDALKTEIAAGKVELVRASTVQHRLYNHVILATGFSIEQESVEIETPMGVVQRCDLGFGWRNTGARGLWFLGPSSKSNYWEITAIPDIRSQVMEVVQAMKATSKNHFSGLFVHHPRTAGESYQDHLAWSTRVATDLLKMSFQLFVHSIFPFVFEQTTSQDLRRLFNKISRRRGQTARKKAS